MELGSLPLEQSIVISEIEWNEDAGIIDEDEKQFRMNNDSQISDLQHLTDEEEELEDSPVLRDQSWGCYFSERSGAMGDISGTAKLRPEFSSPNHAIKLNKLLNQSSNKTKVSTISERNESCDSMNIDEDEEMCDISNDAKLSVKDLSSSIEITSQDKIEEPMTPRSLIAELSPILPDENNEETENSDDCVNNLLSEFQSISMSPNNDSSLMIDSFIDENVDTAKNNETNKQLSLAIKEAIQRRRSFEPMVILKETESLTELNPQNQSIFEEHVEDVDNNKIVTVQMPEIKQSHRFIHFNIDAKQMNSSNIDDTRNECRQLLEDYVSKFKNINQNLNKTETIAKIAFQTMWYDVNNNQCTFYILIESNAKQINSSNESKWSKCFVELLNEYPIIKANPIFFSQMKPAN